MSRFKAMTPWDLVLVAFALLLCAGVLFILYYSNVLRLVKSAYKIEYSTEMIESGSDAVAMLEYLNNGMYNMDLLGRALSLNSDDYMENTMGDTLRDVYMFQETLITPSGTYVIDRNLVSYDLMVDYYIGFIYRYGEPLKKIECGIETPAKFLSDGKPRFTLTWPFKDVENPHVGTVTSLEGPRWIFDDCGCHSGMDFSCEEGKTDILAVHPGRVDYADWHEDSKKDHTKSYGVVVRMEHWIDADNPEDARGEPDFYTYYGHLYKDSIVVDEGDWVQAGQTIAKCGNTGLSTGSHLHLELRDSESVGRFMDPCPFFEEKPFECGFMQEKPRYCGNEEDAKISFDVPVPGAIIRNGIPKTKALGVLYLW